MLVHLASSGWALLFVGTETEEKSTGPALKEPSRRTDNARWVGARPRRERLGTVLWG